MDAWVCARDGGAVTFWGNRKGRAMNVLTNDALTWLPVETEDVTRLREILRAREEADAHRRVEELVRRDGDDGVLRERDFLRVRAAVLEGRVDELRRQFAALNCA